MLPMPHSSTCHSLLLATVAMAVAVAAPAVTHAQMQHDGHAATHQHEHFRINPALAQAESARAALPRRTELGGHVPDLPRGAAAPTSAEPPVPNPELGSLTWPAGTTNAEAQAWFNQGYRYAWAFNHAEAARAFRMAQQADPDCAMCLWGEAWVLGPHINFIMEEDAGRRAFAALERARQLAPQVGEMRAALIEALSQRYAADPKAERKPLDQAFADAMRKVQARWPADPDVAMLTADALMNLSPWDYWEDAGRQPKGATAEILALLEGVLGTRLSPITANPLHPGAIHLYIHTVEASDHPERAAPHAARLAALMPAAGHIVHMPAHIWYRLGMWRDSLDANLRAVAADEAQIARGGASALYAQGYFAHNVHFVMVSSMMGGDGPRAVEAAARLASIVSDDAKRAFPGLTQPVVSAPFVAHARFSPPETILALPAPTDEFPFIRAHWHYARGVALAQSDRVSEARGEAAAIGELARLAAIQDLPAQGVPAPEVLGIAMRVVNARIAQAAGDQATAATFFAEAAAIQDTLPYMEPPFWYYPVHQSLGATLLAQGKPAEAEEAFRQALKRVPNNAWAAAGLLKAAEMRGDSEGVAIARRILQKSWFGAQPPVVERL